MKKFQLFILAFISFQIFFSSRILAGGEDKKNTKHQVLQKTSALNPTQSLMNINNATMWITEEGFHDWIINSNWNGSFPNGSNVGCIFSEGILWGGKVYDGDQQVIRVNGNTSRTGFSRKKRLFRVRPDYLTADLTADAASFYNIPIDNVTSDQIQAVKEQYSIDWQEWPTTEGAPFKDIDNNGVYDPMADVAGIPGSSQTLFIKYDDSLSESSYGSKPIGLEVSETYWAYSYSGALGNVIYKKINMVYKGTSTSLPNSFIDSLYITQWSDPDVGTSTNDFAGCDTTLNLGYAYNSGSTDVIYANIGMVPPAVGYVVLNGLSKYTGNISDSAIVNLCWKKGYKYVNYKPMSSFIFFGTGTQWIEGGFNYSGTLVFYDFMRGYIYPGENFPVSVADYTPYGVYLLSGNPVDGTGKIDGVYDGPGDRRILSVTGPVNLALEDSVEVVMALVFGMENSYLSSIAQLKNNSLEANNFFNEFVHQNTITDVNVLNINGFKSFKLNQNYPNPFNPTTKISWQSPSAGYQSIKLYDVLGNEIATLVNEYKNADTYEIDFDASKLPSGIYFYQFKSGNFIETKKMILLK